MRVMDAVAKMEDLPLTKTLMCQVVDAQGKAWNMHFNFADVPGTDMAVIQVFHPDLKELPAIDFGAGTHYPPQGHRSIWFIRDNNTTRRLPLNVDEALAVLKEEFDQGSGYGMLCTHRYGSAPAVHSRGNFEEFAAQARPWLVQELQARDL